MAGIGEASAVVGVIQVGFSLATALNTYISDASSASDDISSLVSDIEATLGQLRDLAKLIEKNKTVRAWSEDGLRNANKCVTDCEKIITKLRKLLQKSTASATSDQITRDDIDLSKLERARWPFIKPQMEVRRRELQSIKQDIVIAYASYMTQVGTEAERQKFSADLPKLQRTRLLAQRQVREAKERRRQKASKYSRDTPKGRFGYLPPVVTPLDHTWHYERDIKTRTASASPSANPSEDGRGSIQNDDDGPLVYDNIEELEREFETWKIEEEEQKARFEAEKKAIQEDAVRDWKVARILEAETKQQNIDNARASLRAELRKQRMAPQQIEDIVNHVHPNGKLDGDVSLLITTTNDNNSSLTPSLDPTRVSSLRRWSLWPKKKSILRRHFSTATTLANEPHAMLVPDILSDPTAEGGIARLEAIFFHREVREPPRIQAFCVEIPDKWLLDSLVKRQEAIALDRKKVNSVWKDFSNLPAGYRHAIGEYIADKKYITDKKDSGRSGENITWVLFHLDSMMRKRRRHVFDRLIGEDVVGVYVVLKENRKPMYRSPEREELIREREIQIEDALRDRDRNRDRDQVQNRGRDEDRDVDRDYHGFGKDIPTNEMPRPLILNAYNTQRKRSKEGGYKPRYSRSSVKRDTTGSRSRHPMRESHNQAILPSSEQHYPEHPAPLATASNARSSQLVLQAFRPSHRPVSPEAHPSRSQSPKPLRRSGTDESQRSSDSQVNLDLRRDERGPQGHLNTIFEVVTDSNSDSSSSTDHSNDDEIDISRRFVLRRPRQETDEELLDKTLREYVNPTPPSQNGIRAEVAATSASSVHTNGAEETTATAISGAEEP